MGIERLAVIGNKLKEFFERRSQRGVGETRNSELKFIPPMPNGTSALDFVRKMSVKTPEGGLHSDQGLNPIVHKEISDILEQAEKPQT